jgi:hypothetical protein
MRKAAMTAFIFATIHALVCLWLIPRTNTAFQSWFDTGAPMSKVEGVGHVVASALSFPVALWTLTLHPARVSTGALVMSVLVNSSLWASCLFALLVWLRRRAASNNGMHPTPRHGASH